MEDGCSVRPSLKATEAPKEPGVIAHILALGRLRQTNLYKFKTSPGYMTPSRKTKKQEKKKDHGLAASPALLWMYSLVTIASHVSAQIPLGDISPSSCDFL